MFLNRVYDDIIFLFLPHREVTSSESEGKQMSSKRNALISLLLIFMLIGVVSAAVYLYFEWQISLTPAVPEVQFYRWSDQTNATTIDLPYNIYADAWVKDDNATYGIRNWNTTASQTVYVWFESVTGASYVANATVFVIDEDGSTELAKITTDGASNLGEGNAQSWTASHTDTGIDTLRIWVQGESTVGAVTINLGMKTAE